MHNFYMYWCRMIEWMHLWKKIKERMTENAWNNLGQLNWTLPFFASYVFVKRREGRHFQADDIVFGGQVQTTPSRRVWWRHLTINIELRHWSLDGATIGMNKMSFKMYNYVHNMAIGCMLTGLKWDGTPNSKLNHLVSMLITMQACL